MSKNFVKRLFEWTGNIQIINWRNIDTNKFWGGLLLFICHPIYSIKYERNCYDSFVWRVNNFFTRTLWKYMPLNKYCRWLGHNLVHSTSDNKYIDTFWASCYKKNVSYHAFCLFGYVHVWSRTKKNKTIYKGWVFTKKKAIRIFKEVIKKNKKIYSDKYLDTYEPYYMEITDTMLEILHTGKVHNQSEFWLSNAYLDEMFKHSKDNIEKLWCYVTDMMTCVNDFDCHQGYAHICRACDLYIYHHICMKKDPMIDYTYRLTLEKQGEKKAKQWLNSQVRYYNLKKCTKWIEDHIGELRKYYEEKDIFYKI